MHGNSKISGIEARRAGIRLPAEDFYAAAGFHRTTWQRALEDPSRIRNGNLEAAAAVVEADERRLLAYLISLHPDLARQLLSAGSGNGTGGEGGLVAGVRPAGSSSGGSSAEEEAA